MHDTARLTGDAFFRVYGDVLPPGVKILDVGSLDVNGTLRPWAPKGSTYTGVDLQDGLGVDVVLEHPGILPFNSADLGLIESGEGFDLIVSTSCLEHDPAFWQTFAEMARVLKPGGFIYVSVPAAGPYHGYPGDCWRFYGDAAAALATWYNRLAGPGIKVVETFMVPPRNDIWTDNVMIFGKPPIPERGSLRAYLRDRGLRHYS